MRVVSRGGLIPAIAMYLVCLGGIPQLWSLQTPVGVLKIDMPDYR
ncbi:hypothetical protein [Bradyrhizobium yuanmingense]|nr:hypothetical protein [Bradyrhizobium yuanmingense]